MDLYAFIDPPKFFSTPEVYMNHFQKPSFHQCFYLLGYCFVRQPDGITLETKGTNVK